MLNLTQFITQIDNMNSEVGGDSGVILDATKVNVHLNNNSIQSPMG